MRQFTSIALNTFMELVRQPVFLLLMTCSSAFIVFLAAVPYFGFGDDPKLVTDGALALTLVAGLFGAVISASASLAHEIRSGTALAVLSKPVGRTRFYLAKYAGLAGALALLTYINTISSLMASRMTFDAYDSVDKQSQLIFYGAMALAYLVAGFTNFFLRRPFIADTVLTLVITTTVAFLIIGLMTSRELAFGVWAETDWRLVPASLLILFALWILAGIALACSTRLDMIPTLAICTAVFLLGLMSDYLFGRQARPVWNDNLRAEIEDTSRSLEQRDLLKIIAENYDLDGSGWLEPGEADAISPEDRERMIDSGLGGHWWASMLYTAVPNWQLFWLADALQGSNDPMKGDDRTSIPWSYVGKSLGYMVGYLGAALLVGLILFEDRELS